MGINDVVISYLVHLFSVSNDQVGSAICAQRLCLV